MRAIQVFMNHTGMDSAEYWFQDLEQALKARVSVKELVKVAKEALDCNGFDHGEQYWKDMEAALAPYLR